MNVTVQLQIQIVLSGNMQGARSKAEAVERFIQVLGQSQDLVVRTEG